MVCAGGGEVPGFEAVEEGERAERAEGVACLGLVEGRVGDAAVEGLVGVLDGLEGGGREMGGVLLIVGCS